MIDLLPYILFEKYSSILALEMASTAIQHCANFIGALSFPTGACVLRVVHTEHGVARRGVVWTVLKRSAGSTITVTDYTSQK